MAPRRPRLTAVPITDSGTPTVRVALYRRASTDEANQPYSLDAQEQRLRPYAASHPGWQVVGDYVERASAKDVEGRPQLKALLKAAAAGEFDLVLVARIDRWSAVSGTCCTRSMIWLLPVWPSTRRRSTSTQPRRWAS